MFTDTMLGILSQQEEICGLKPAHACCFLQSSSVSCLVFILSVGLNHIFTSSSPMLAWLTQWHTHSFHELGEKHLHHQLIHLTDIPVYLKQRLTSGRLCSEMKSASLQLGRSIMHGSFLWASRAQQLPASIDTNFVAEVYLSVTQQRKKC